jgi:CubicO group peptidase (beta-lactamase class C family)
MNKSRVTFISLILMALGSFSLPAQVEKNSTLFKTLKKQDSIFFERAFNQCDLKYLDNHIAKDLKFFHDQSGFQDRETFFNNTKQYICSNRDKKPIRKVSTNSLEVFPLFNNGKLYGAIQKGEHNFYIRENGKEDVLTNIALFTHVWLSDGEDWVLSEALSYDHKDPAKNTVDRVNDIEKLLIDNNVPALGLGIIENGKLTKVEVYGTLDKNQKAPYNTIFKVASLTKPVIALTVLKLVDKGLLDLHEPLYKYWIDPDLKNDKRYKDLTPYLVLTHQTGFPNWRYMTDSNKLHFQFNPGDKYQYSGEGFEYLRKAIEKKLGRSIEELAQEFLFIPAGMTDTRFWWDNAMDETRYAQNFDENGNNIKTVKYYEANAAANLLTTVEDYGRFIAYVINGAGLKTELFQEMQKHQVKLRENDFFGIGWEILTGFSDGEFAMLHTGKDPGVSTLAIMFPQSKNGYVVLLNGDNVNSIYEHILTNTLYLGAELWDRR